VSKAARWSLVALAVVVAVAAFLIARPGEDDGGEQGDAGQTAAETAPADTAPTATAPSAPKPPPDGPDATVVTLRDYAVGEVESIEVEKGDQVRLVFRSNVPDSIHIHGYDLEQEAAPGQPARFSFPADIEGVFEIESHEAEHQGKDALIARLVVEPS
jgi:FtsP/CotA-like multicopper oxidase with cupredoxin domain